MMMNLDDTFHAPHTDDHPPSSVSSLHVYGSDGDTMGEVVFHIHDVDSFVDGAHHARICLSKKEARKLANRLLWECVDD